GAGSEQAATPIAAQTAAIAPRARATLRVGASVQCTIDILRELARDAVDRLQVLDARRADAARAAESLQQPGALLRADAGNLLERAGAGANARAARAHAGDREAVRLVAD